MYRPILITMTKADALKLLEQYKQGKIDKSSIVKYQFREKILDQDIIVDNVLLNLAAVKPADDLQKLYEHIHAEDQVNISIKFVSAVNAYDDTLLHVRSKMVDRSPLQFDFPDTVKAFVKESKLMPDTLYKLALIEQQISEFLDKRKLEHKVKMDLFEDPEENWKEIRMRIKIKEELSDKNLESPIYDIIDKSLHDEVSDKMIIKLEPL